jgi:uncharacterized lipoprotein YehR (DUF1307 family)
VKPTFLTFALLAFAIVCAVELSGCGKEAASEITSSTAPINELDLKINDYDKVANEYARVARKLDAGDVSLTVRYIDLEKQTREAAAKLQQDSSQMTPPQAQRVAAISARTAPYFR